MSYAGAHDRVGREVCNSPQLLGEPDTEVIFGWGPGTMVINGVGNFSHNLFSGPSGSVCNISNTGEVHLSGACPLKAEGISAIYPF